MLRCLVVCCSVDVSIMIHGVDAHRTKPNHANNITRRLNHNSPLPPLPRRGLPTRSTSPLVVNNSILYYLIAGYLPVVALLLLMMILPFFFQVRTRHRRRICLYRRFRWR